MTYKKLDKDDKKLITAAAEAIRRNYFEDRHHVGSAVRTGSGRVYVGVHMESSGHDICAEPVALGSAAAAGERDFRCIVSVAMRAPADDRPVVLSPCGNCRELLLTHWPEMEVIVSANGRLVKTTARQLLPAPYVRPRGAGERRNGSADGGGRP